MTAADVAGPIGTRVEGVPSCVVSRSPSRCSALLAVLVGVGSRPVVIGFGISVALDSYWYLVVYPVDGSHMALHTRLGGVSTVPDGAQAVRDGRVATRPVFALWGGRRGRVVVGRPLGWVACWEVRWWYRWDRFEAEVGWVGGVSIRRRDRRRGVGLVCRLESALGSVSVFGIAHVNTPAIQSDGIDGATAVNQEVDRFTCSLVACSRVICRNSYIELSIIRN